MDLFGSISITKMPKDLPRFVKWEDTVIGEIFDNGRVEFSDPTLNTAVSIITGGKSGWSTPKFREFLSDRLPSKNRRDIEKILHRWGLSTYDEFSMASVTRALNAKDLFWLATSEDEKFEDIRKDTDISKLVDLNISESQVREAISNASITGDRFEYSVIWVCECLKLLKSY